MRRRIRVEGLHSRLLIAKPGVGLLTRAEAQDAAPEVSAAIRQTLPAMSRRFPQRFSPEVRDKPQLILNAGMSAHDQPENDRTVPVPLRQVIGISLLACATLAIVKIDVAKRDRWLDQKR